MSNPLRLVVLLSICAVTGAAQQSPNPVPTTPFVPLEVLNAKTIAVSVYWPDARWRDKAEVQGEGEAFLRKWRRYKVVRVSENPDLIALVTVEPTSQSGGFWTKLAYALAVGAKAYAQSAQSYEECRGQVNGDQINVNCKGYSRGTPSAPPPPPGPTYVLGGTIMVFDGRFLRTGAAIPEPSMFAEADHRGRMPLIGAAKRMRQMVEQAEKAEPARLAAVNALIAKVHELAAADGLPESEEPACSQKIAVQIRANRDMLARLERRDLTDVQSLFRQFCEPSDNH